MLNNTKGTLLEKFLTYSENEFRLLQPSVSPDANPDKVHEPYRYAEVLHFQVPIVNELSNNG